MEPASSYNAPATDSNSSKAHPEILMFGKTDAFIERDLIGIILAAWVAAAFIVGTFIGTVINRVHEAKRTCD